MMKNIACDYIAYKKGVIFNKSPHLEKQLCKKKCSALMIKHKGWYVKNTYNFDTSEPTSYWFIIKDSFGGMEELKCRTKNKVRRALRFFDIKPISVDMMREQGYDVYLDSFRRYGKSVDKILTRSLFLEDLDRNKEGREFWGVIDKTDGTLVAYAENFQKEGMCDYYMLKVRSRYLSKGYYPFYGLFYKMNEYYLSQQHIKYVSIGGRTATEQSNIQSFMMSHFSFRKAYVIIRLNYVFILKLLVHLLYPLRTYIPSSRVKALLCLEAMSRGDI